MASKLAAGRRRTNLILLVCGVLLIVLKLASAPWPDANTGRFINLGVGAGVSGASAGDRQAQEGMITMTINPDPVFETGDAEGNLLIENDAENSHSIVVEIALQDTEEVVYTSGYIPVGMYVNEDRLAVSLPAGDYPCVASFHYVDEGTGNVLGSGGVAITLHVLH